MKRTITIEDVITWAESATKAISRLEFAIESLLRRIDTYEDLLLVMHDAMVSRDSSLIQGALGQYQQIMGKDEDESPIS